MINVVDVIPKRDLSMAQAWLATIFCCCALLVGCQDKVENPVVHSPAVHSGASEQSQYRNQLLRSAINLVNTPEQFNDDRQASAQIVEQLNQWRRLAEEATVGNSDKVLPSLKPSGGGHEATDNSSSDGAQTIDSEGVAINDRNLLLDTLPQDKNNDLLNSRWVRKLNDKTFDPTYDGTFLQEAALLRDTANSVEAAKLDDLSIATALFDWTVRNIQSEPPAGPNATPEEQWLDRHLPGETLYYGRGTPLQRAWLFMLLARQGGLDVVLLATPNPRNPKQARPWTTALVSNGELYLFDYTYGLPIPGPDGKGVATLSQAATNDSILRQMDTSDLSYPRRSAELDKVIVLLEASPGYLERRMKLLESQLTGHDRMVLSTSPSALVDKLRSMKHVGEIKLWALPYETLEQRKLLSPELQRAAFLERMPFTIPAEPEEDSKHHQSEDPQRRRRPIYALRLGRLLQLRGLFGKTETLRPTNEHGPELSAVAQNGATTYYLMALPTNDRLTELVHDQQDRIEIAPGRYLSKEFVDAFQQQRDDAAFWLGIVSLEQGDNETAAQYFGPLTLDAYPEGPWTNAARFLLARCYEAEGKLAEAIKLYEADRTPQRYGNRLRAERLKAQLARESPKKSSASVPEKLRDSTPSKLPATGNRLSKP